MDKNKDACINQENLSSKEFLLNLIYYFKYLKNNKRVYLIWVIFSFLFSIAIFKLQKNLYEANLTFAMEEEKGGSNLGGALSIASSIGIDLGNGGGGGAFALSNIGELMRSRLIIEKTLFKPIVIDNDTTTLLNYYIQINNLSEKWNLKNQPPFPIKNINKSNFTFRQDSLIAILYHKLIKKENLIIDQKDKKVTILNIKVKNKDEIFSKLFCENLAKETSEFYIAYKSKKSKNNVEILQKQVDSIKNQLNIAIFGFGKEVDNVYNLNPAFNIKNSGSKTKQIDVQANTAILTNLVVQLEPAKVTLRKETPLIQVIDYPILPLEKNKIGKMKYTLIFISIGMFFSICSILVNKIIKQNI